MDSELHTLHCHILPVVPNWQWDAVFHYLAPASESVLAGANQADGKLTFRIVNCIKNVPPRNSQYLASRIFEGCEIAEDIFRCMICSICT